MINYLIKKWRERMADRSTYDILAIPKEKEQ